MDVAFSLPEDLARKLQERWGDLSRRALESLVAQAYREESLTLGEVRRILGHETRMETEAFLKEQGALLDYSEEELEQAWRPPLRPRIGRALHHGATSFLASIAPGPCDRR
jgi:predicted HTH domain antitoxin